MDRKKIKNKLELFEKVFDEMDRDNIGAITAQCSYYTILSFMPFVMLVLTLIQYTGIEAETLFEIISKIIPSTMSDMVLGIVREVYSKSIGTISLSLIFIIWAAGRGLFALMQGLQRIFNIAYDKKLSFMYLKVSAIIETILFIALIVIGLILLVFGSSMHAIIQERIYGITNNTIIPMLITKLSYIFVTFVIFLMLYKIMPKHKVTFKSQMYGAIFGAITLNIISFIFSNYLYIFRNFSITYGSLTTLMLIMMWTYACFYTVFLGAELNKIVEEGRKIYEEKS